MSKFSVTKRAEFQSLSPTMLSFFSKTVLTIDTKFWHCIYNIISICQVWLKLNLNNGRIIRSKLDAFFISNFLEIMIWGKMCTTCIMQICYISQNLSNIWLCCKQANCVNTRCEFGCKCSHRYRHLLMAVKWPVYDNAPGH